MRGEIKESRLAYKSEWLEVYEDLLSIDAQPDKRGKKDNLHQQHHKNTNNVILFNKIKLKSDSATILPVFSDGSLLMIEIYRRGIDKFLLDLPSGLIENNEKPNETAKRELLHETGYSCRTLKHMGWFYTWPSKSNQKSYLFLAKGLKKASSQCLDAIENINTKIVTKDELMLKLTNREIKSAGAVSAIFYGYLLTDYG
jgi:ADP-ribose pyrophosphatase